MKYGRVFFLVNSKTKVNLLDRDLILLFGSAQDFKKRVSELFPKMVQDVDGVLVIKTENSILEFYYGTEEIIERFVMVDVLFTDYPLEAVAKLCVENKWLLYDLTEERYVNVSD